MDFLSYLIIAIGIGLSAWVAIKQKPWWQLTPEEKKKRLPFIITGAVLVILGIVFIVWQLSVQKNESNNLIGGEKDEHGCLIAAGYSWCEAKQKCLRVWEEGCGKTNQLASRNNISQDKETCEAQSGEWGRFGLVVKEQCNLPTSDAGKTCSNQDECEGACIVELSQEEQDRITKQKEVIETKGKCTSRLLTYGCDAYVKDGKVDSIFCSD